MTGGDAALVRGRLPHPAAGTRTRLSTIQLVCRGGWGGATHGWRGLPTSETSTSSGSCGSGLDRDCDERRQKGSRLLLQRSVDAGAGRPSPLASSYLIWNRVQSSTLTAWIVAASSARSVYEARRRWVRGTPDARTHNTAQERGDDGGEPGQQR